MAVIRAQAVLLNVSGLPRDNAVNTFHFNGPTDEATLLAIDTAIDRFYRTIVANGQSVDQYLSTVVNKLVVKLYDVTDEPSGPPLLVSAERSLAATRLGGANLPEEVAVCLSFAGTPEAGLVQSRRRGRIYLGPLRDAAVNPGSSANMTSVATALYPVLAGAGQRLATEVDSAAEWVVYSRPFAGRGEIVRPGRSTLPAIPARPGTTVNIDQVSIDNALDTQRRRGRKPSDRNVYATGE